ncbi:TraB/GumN family protein [Myroides sp. DW712]|uniref:TraB/GumN family protein n=1 Tax=Myroides sp. DW712 TaxID=3389800 RepID=UPI00397D36D9
MEQKKEFIGLEHFSDQIRLINQVYTAKEILAQLYEDEVDNYEVLAAAFKQEDSNALYQLAVDSKQLTAEGKTMLIDNRNQAWVEKMVEIMPKERTLFAVGAGHLAGKLGVIALLRAKGFTVTAILN